MLISSIASGILLVIITASQLHNVVFSHVTPAAHNSASTSVDRQRSITEASADSQSNDENDLIFDLRNSLLSILNGHGATDGNVGNDGSGDNEPILAESKMETLEPVQYDWFWNIV